MARSLPVMAGEGPASTTCQTITAKDVDGGPSPTMTMLSGRYVICYPGWYYNNVAPTAWQCTIGAAAQYGVTITDGR